MITSQIEAIRCAAKLLGSQRALAVALGVAPVNVSQWINTDGSKGRPVPPKQCVRIEALTSGAVLRQQLRPDDWREIWPELADAKPNQHPAPAHQAQEAINPATEQGAAHA